MKKKKEDDKPISVTFDLSPYLRKIKHEEEKKERFANLVNIPGMERVQSLLTVSATPFRSLEREEERKREEEKQLGKIPPKKKKRRSHKISSKHRKHQQKLGKNYRKSSPYFMKKSKNGAVTPKKKVRPPIVYRFGLEEFVSPLKEKEKKPVDGYQREWERLLILQDSDQIPDDYEDTLY